MWQTRARALQDSISIARRIKRDYRKSYGAQAKEIIRLRFGSPLLGASEYYQYGLYNDRKFTYEEKQAFVGWRQSAAIDRALNAQMWRVITADKIVSNLLFRQLGLPCPRMLAIYDSKRRQIPGVTAISTMQQLSDFLAGASYPMFVKPVHAGQGRGAMLMTSFDRTRNIIEHSAGELSLDEVHKLLESEASLEGGGYVFQEVVRPHAEAAGLTGNRLPGIRIIILYSGSVPKILSAVIKLPCGPNITDNFCSGKTGNLIGKVKLESGAVQKAFALGPAGYEPVAVHPDTGKRLLDFVIPDWQECKSLVLAGASNFPGLQLQHWDAAIGERGPQFLEINGEGCLELPQIVHEQGFLQLMLPEDFSNCGIHAAQWDKITADVPTNAP